VELYYTKTRRGKPKGFGKIGTRVRGRVRTDKDRESSRVSRSRGERRTWVEAKKHFEGWRTVFLHGEKFLRLRCR